MRAVATAHSGEFIIYFLLSPFGDIIKLFSYVADASAFLLQDANCCFAGSGRVRRISRLHNYYQLLQTQLPLSHDDSPVGPGRLVWDTLSTLYGPLDLGNL